MHVNRVLRIAIFVALGAFGSTIGAAETNGGAKPPQNAPSATPESNAPPPESNTGAPTTGPAAPSSAPPVGFTEAQRKGMITANIAFGKDEADGFWPLYRDYRRDVGKLQDRRAKAINDYTEIFRTMTGDQAKAILEDVLQTDEEISKVKRDYLKKFRKFLPETKVTRFYLIDAKIDLAAEAILMTKVQTIGEAPR
jgi:hypothetical protein